MIKPTICTYFLHCLQWQKPHFHAFTFHLNSSRDLCLVCRFTQKNCARYVTISIPYLTVFLFSVKISRKFLMSFVLQRNWKRELIIGDAIPLSLLISWPMHIKWLFLNLRLWIFHKTSYLLSWNLKKKRF